MRRCWPRLAFWRRDPGALGIGAVTYSRSKHKDSRTGKRSVMRCFQIWPTAYVAAAAISAAASVTAAAATPEQAKALSERAAAHIEQAGEEKAFADFTQGNDGFIDGELYVFCYDHKGVNKANGGNPSFVA